MTCRRRHADSRRTPLAVVLKLASLCYRRAADSCGSLLDVLAVLTSPLTSLAHSPLAPSCARWARHQASPSNHQSRPSCSTLAQLFQESSAPVCQVVSLPTFSIAVPAGLALIPLPPHSRRLRCHLGSRTIPAPQFRYASTRSGRGGAAEVLQRHVGAAAQSAGVGAGRAQDDRNGLAEGGVGGCGGLEKGCGWAVESVTEMHTWSLWSLHSSPARVSELAFLRISCPSSPVTRRCCSSKVHHLSCCCCCISLRYTSSPRLKLELTLLFHALASL